jgi:hypothetical protein
MEKKNPFPPPSLRKAHHSSLFPNQSNKPSGERKKKRISPFHPKENDAQTETAK